MDFNFLDTLVHFAPSIFISVMLAIAIWCSIFEFLPPKYHFPKNVEFLFFIGYFIFVFPIFLSFFDPIFEFAKELNWLIHNES